MRKIIVVVLAVLALPVSAYATAYDPILDQVQQTGFNYFWNEANPANGLIRDRSQIGSPCSIAAVGFGLTAICIGIDHGWITRAQGAARVQTTLNTFWNGVQRPAPDSAGHGVAMGYKGFFYHFLDMNTGMRMWTSELSDIDTGLLLAGILDSRQYFNGADPTEVSIRTLADQIYQRTDWTFFQKASPQGLMVQWTPESGFNTGVWTGYNEMMIMYILAMGSPTHAVPAGDWNTYFSTYNWNIPAGGYGGVAYLIFPPLFGHQYSHCWIDFRNKRDAFMQFKGSDYFTNSRRATLAQQAYCIANPGIKSPGPPAQPDPANYSAILWGLTAGDGPAGYNARGAPPAQNDDGTIAPTAVVSSICFAPEICLPTIQNFYDNYPLLWGTYGFRDGFNLCRNPDWYDTDYIGIDLGPEVIMIENYRNASVWLRFMQNPSVQAGMTAAGFVNTVDVPPQPIATATRAQVWCGPNPFAVETAVHYTLPAAGTVRLTVHDVMGREVARLLDGWQPAGSRTVRFRGDGLANGVYWYRLSTPDGAVENKGVLMR